MATPHKIAVIGAKGFAQRTSEARVDSFDWDEIRTIANLRDYDSVLINVLSASGATFRWRPLFDLLNPFVAAEILRPGGQIIVVGDPRFELSGEEIVPTPFLYWTCLDFTWDDRPGDTVIVNLNWRNEDRYKNYLSHLKQWDYSLVTARMNQAAIAGVYNLEQLKATGAAVEHRVVKLAYNRYRNPLAFEINLGLTRGGQWSDNTTWGPIVFLPRIPLSEDETISLVLKDLCGVEGPPPEPEWVRKTKAPGQDIIDSELADALKKLREQVAVVETKKAELAAARSVLDALADGYRDPAVLLARLGWFVDFSAEVPTARVRQRPLP